MSWCQIRVRLLGGVLAVGLASGSAVTGQQNVDSKFDAKVAKPAYAADKHPRVLFDEAHFNVHTSKTGYKPFADLVTNDGYQVKANDKPFDAASLAVCDILVVANARGAALRSERPAFMAAECDAVAAWVKAGGSLLLVTDHYPTGHAAEMLSLRFEVDMSKGRTTDANNRAPGAGGPGLLLFSRENKLLADHAITNGRDKSERLDKVMTFTGQSLKGPPGSVSFLVLGKTAVDVLPAENNKQVSAEGRAQGVALRFGQGRVVVLGEASQISAQLAGPQKRPMGMNYPGIDNRQMVLNIMHWLSGLLDAAAPAAEPDAKQKAVQEEWKLRNGTWEPAGAVIDGQERPAPKERRMVLEYKDEKYTDRVGDRITGTGLSKIDPTQSPKTLDIIPERNGTPGRTAQAIYELKGDELKVCMARPGNERPKEFESKPGSGLILLKFKRVKP